MSGKEIAVVNEYFTTVAAIRSEANAIFVMPEKVEQKVEVTRVGYNSHGKMDTRGTIFPRNLKGGLHRKNNVLDTLICYLA